MYKKCGFLLDVTVKVNVSPTPWQPLHTQPVIVICGSILAKPHCDWWRAVV